MNHPPFIAFINVHLFGSATLRVPPQGTMLHGSTTLRVPPQVTMLHGAFVLFVALVFLKFGPAEADPPIKVCVNTFTKNLSLYLHESKSVNPALDSLDSPTAKGRKLGEFMSSQRFLEGGSLHKVRLAPHSPQGIAQEKNLQYLLMLDVDSLVYSFRNVSGVPLVGVAYGGWEAPDKELRGHFVGHYLSATSMMWASTHNEELYKRMNALVDALSECQEKLGTGYLSAFPESYFDRFEALHIVWAPYYTVHKIMAGLLDQYEYAGNDKALKMVVWMADYFSKRVKSYVEKFTVEAQFQALNQEVGGMNDIMYKLYRITKNETYLEIGHLFDKPCFLGLLAIKEDSLSGFHANTHIPLVIGSQSRFEVTGDEIYKVPASLFCHSFISSCALSKELAMFFMNIVNASHSFATGGTSVREFWVDPKRLATSLDKDTEETCTTYNMLKVARTLFRWTKDIKYMEYYEKALTNGIMTIQRGNDVGVTLYMLPLAPGSSKNSSTLHWGTKFDSFWCCYGTAIESMSKLGDSIYFHNGDDTMQDEETDLYITQFVSSNFTWDVTGLLLQQTVKNSISTDNPDLVVEIKFLQDDVHGHMQRTTPEQTRPVNLHVRVPSWTNSDCKATLNGETLELVPGTFKTVTRVFQPEDVMEFSFPATLRLEHIQDDRTEYSDVQAIFFGPFLLAGLSSGEWETGPLNLTSISTWLRPVSQQENQLLYSLAQDSSSAGANVTTELLGHANGTLLLDKLSSTGQDWNFQATFRVHTHSQTGAGLAEGSMVSLELMDQPGLYLAHDGALKKVLLVNVSSVPSITSTLFTVTPGLSKQSGTVSLQAVGHNECFVKGNGNGAPAELNCDPSAETFHASSFRVQQGAAKYHPITFMLNAPKRSFLVFPLNDYVDEHYTVYFNMKL